MDSSSADGCYHQNWLGFSLSNYDHMNAPQLCLFEAFNTSSSSTSATVVDSAQEDQNSSDLSIFTRSDDAEPKLENFLGSGSTTAPSLSNSLSHYQFSAKAPVTINSSTAMVTESSTSQIYNSELKSIAASFLGVFPSATEPQQKQTDINHQQQFMHHQPLSQISNQSTPRKAVNTFGQRTSIYRGVTRHRWTGRYEAHLWDNSCRREGQSRKGRQVYLGGYDKEERAARAYDLAALKYWGLTTTTNFPISNYEKELVEMKHMTKQEFIASLRRKSSGFSRGASVYRGVTKHHQHGRWQARIGRVAGNKDLYLGTFSTQEEAAEAYDIAAIKFRGLNAVTNFDMNRYDVKSIANSNLPIGGLSGKSKNSSDSTLDTKKANGSRLEDPDLSSVSSITLASQPTISTLNFAMPIKQDPTDFWSNILGCCNDTSSTTINNNKNENANVAQSFLFPPLSMGSINVGNSPVNGSNHNDSNEGCNLQQHSAISSSIPFTFSGSGGNYEGNSGYGSRNAKSLHDLQSAKANLSMFQTPIFGME